MSDLSTRSNRPSNPVTPPPRKQSAGRKTPEELQNRKGGRETAPHSRIVTHSQTLGRSTLRRPFIQNEEPQGLANTKVKVGKKKNDPNTKWGRFTKVVANFFNWILRGCIGIRERTAEIPKPERADPVTQNLNRMITRRVKFTGDTIRNLPPEKQQTYNHHIQQLGQEIATHANGLEWNRQQIEQTSFHLSSIDDVLGTPDAEDVDKFDRGEFESTESLKKSTTLSAISERLEDPTTPEPEELTDKVQILQKMAARRKTKYDPRVFNLKPSLQNMYTLNILVLHQIINSHLEHTKLTQTDILIAANALQNMDAMFKAPRARDVAALKN